MNKYITQTTQAFGARLGHALRIQIKHAVNFVLKNPYKSILPVSIFLVLATIATFLVSSYRKYTINQEIIRYYSQDIYQDLNSMNSESIKKNILSNYKSFILTTVGSKIAYMLYNNDKIEDSTNILQYILNKDVKYDKDIIYLNLIAMNLKQNFNFKIKLNDAYDPLLQEFIAESYLYRNNFAKYKDIITALNQKTDIPLFMKGRLEEILYALHS